jgi:hypothetical protein
LTAFILSGKAVIPSSDNTTQILHLSLSNYTFPGVQLEVGGLETLKYIFQALHVFFY